MIRSARNLKWLSVLSSLALAAFVVSCNSASSEDDGSGGGGGNGNGSLPVVADSALNGIFLKIKGTSFEMGEADVYRFSPTGQRQVTADYNGTKTFHGNSVGGAAVYISRTATGDSLQTCGTATTNAKFEITVGNNLSAWGGTYRATTCQIKVSYLSETGGLMGTIVSATLKNDSNKTITIADGKFRVFHYSGWPGAAPELTSTSSYMGVLQIDSGSFELKAGQHFRFTKRLTNGYGTQTADGNAQQSGNASDAVVLGFANIPQAGSWACNGVFSGGRTDITVKLGTYLSEKIYSGIPVSGSGSGAACSLKVVGQTNGAKRVSFTGTLVAPDNILSAALRKIKVTGAFKNYSLGKQLAKLNEGTAGADSQEVLVTVDSGSWHFPSGGKYRAAKSFAQKVSGLVAYNAGFVHGGANKDFTVNLMAVPSAAGTYACGALVPGTNPSQYRTAMKVGSADTSGYVGIEYQAFTSSETPGASCSITVAASADTSVITGTYTARLSAAGAGALLPDGDTTLVVTGSFKTKKN